MWVIIVHRGIRLLTHLLVEEYWRVAVGSLENLLRVYDEMDDENIMIDEGQYIVNIYQYQYMVIFGKLET
jgi:hypothetical protein